MPELPEVETVVRDLQPHVVGRCITTVVTVGQPRLRRPCQENWWLSLLGKRIHRLHRRGKWIVFDLSAGLRLVVHLGMTGRLVLAERAQRLPPHTHIMFNLNRKTQLRYCDIRRFGSVSVFDTPDDLTRFFQAARLGPEPFELHSSYWCERLAATRRCVKAVLLDQTVVAGVGNIYADEALFECRLHPARLAQELMNPEAERLRKAVVKVLRRAIEKRGSSIRNYVGGLGLKGRYQDEFRVYGRIGKPCPRCGTPIERLRLAGRSTHYCPRCQKENDER